jgi:hypothetical protein
VAQGESENISSNNRWAIQKRFQDGTYIISTPAYGYGKDEDGNMEGSFSISYHGVEDTFQFRSEAGRDLCDIE